MTGVISYNGDNSEPFNIKSGVKQGCVLAPTLFGIFFSMLLKYAFMHQLMAFSYTQERMADCITLLD